MVDFSLRNLNRVRIINLQDYLDLIKKEWQNELPLNKTMIRDMIEILENMERSN